MPCEILVFKRRTGRMHADLNAHAMMRRTPRYWSWYETKTKITNRYTRYRTDYLPQPYSKTRL